MELREGEVVSKTEARRELGSLLNNSGYAGRVNFIPTHMKKSDKRGAFIVGKEFAELLFKILGGNASEEEVKIRLNTLGFNEESIVDILPNIMNALSDIDKILNTIKESK